MAISRRTLLVLAAVATLAPSAEARSLHVPGDAPTIQAAIELAQYGDSILVAPGTYPENLTLKSGIWIIGEAASTIVDGRFLGPVARADLVQNFTLESLTLRRGYNALYPGGAGLAMDQSRGVIRDCILEDNIAGRDGGGIAVVDSWATVRSTTLRNNSAGALDGGGIFCYRGILVVEGCTLFDNRGQEGGGIAVVNNSTATIRDNIFAGNEALGPGPAGGAIIVGSSAAEITGNTIVRTVVSPTGAAVALVSGQVACERNIVALSTWNGLACTTSPTFCNDVWGSANEDFVGCAPHPSNLSADPLFCDLAGRDFRLDQSSPCAPAHSPPGCGLIGALDVGCGPVAVEDATWGGIKARYR